MLSSLRPATRGLCLATQNISFSRRYAAAAAAAATKGAVAPASAETPAATTPAKAPIHLPILDRPAPNPLKAYKVNRIKNVLQTSQIMLVVQHNNLNDSQWLNFRKAAKKKQWNFTIFPNALFRKCIEHTPFGGLAPLMHSTVGIMYSPTKDLKSALDMIKKEERLLLLGMYAEGMVLDVDLISRYLSTPPVDVLHGQLLALLTANSQRLVALLQRNQVNLLANLTHHVDSQKKDDPPAE
eukprot:comp19348_c0_seq1/m.22278 comp19348_c0_seq1/g.22278  ORF comp19348_c0_seq1/g.22278 comp19348_c0_seq1/m.22278 type:complete len:240 (-) comp19348_c0_seq1:441-1160(-)